MDKVVKSEDEWKAQLSPLAYKVLRKHSTERAYSNDNFPSEPGRYLCAGCDAPLFDAAAKFESGTGWPSFYAPLDTQAVGQSVDRSWFMRRVEVHCNRCDGHLGHVFPDGPRPTGQRYCINGVSLRFERETGP